MYSRLGVFTPYTIELNIVEGDIVEQKQTHTSILQQDWLPIKSLIQEVGGLM